MQEVTHFNSRPRQMLTIRRFEERCNALYMQGKIPSTLHLYNGQEAVAVGVCAHLSVEDTITSTHRPHGHAIAKGVSLRSIMAELYAKDTSCLAARVARCTSAMCPWACCRPLPSLGLGFRSPQVWPWPANSWATGSVGQLLQRGCHWRAFHEALNMAAIWRLPAVFVW